MTRECPGGFRVANRHSSKGHRKVGGKARAKRLTGSIYQRSYFFERLTPRLTMGNYCELILNDRTARAEIIASNISSSDSTNIAKHGRQHLLFFSHDRCL